MDSAGFQPDVLIQNLPSAGPLPEGFATLLRTVDRARYLPDRVWVDGQPVDRQADVQRWATAVYQDCLIVTQFDGGVEDWPTIGETVTSASPRPSALGAMLHALDVDSGHRVLEIGTRTGWSTAMIAERVGSRGEVVTVEADSVLHADSATRLGHYGQIRCVRGDGGAAAPSYGDFDRIVTTVAVPLRGSSPEWVSRCRAGGVIVAPIDVGLGISLVVRFVVDPHGRALGRVLPIAASDLGHNRFGLDANPDPRIDETFIDLDQREGFAESDPVHAWDDPGCRLAMAIALPSVIGGMDPLGATRPYARVWLHDPVSGAAAIVRHVKGTADRYWAHQHGLRRLWDEAETAITWWRGHRSPRVSDWLWILDHDVVRAAPDAAR